MFCYSGFGAKSSPVFIFVEFISYETNFPLNLLPKTVVEAVITRFFYPQYIPIQYQTFLFQSV